MSKPVTLSSKLSDYAQFSKLRLASLVVFSAIIGYLLVAETIDWLRLTMLVLGGFLVTASSNGFNQIMERELDKLMDRTKNRPLPQNRISVKEAFWLASLMGAIGVLLLYFFTNPLSALLGFSALLLYTVIYTPLKQKTPLAVFIGAFPGAIPALLGCVAATDGFGSFTYEGWVMFFIQFMWQFPHFWAIAWVMDDDYKKAGFRMLPSLGGRDKASAFQTLLYSFILVPISLMPLYFNICGIYSGVVILLTSSFFAYQAYRLYSDCTIKSAQRLMFGSFAYLPIVQLAILLG